MKVICIDNSDNGFHSNLTIDKIYDVIVQYDGLTKETHYQVINDNGNTYNYLKTRFKTLEQIREEKLNDILK